MQAKEINLFDFLMSHRNKFIGIDGAKRVGKTTVLTFMSMLLYAHQHEYEFQRLLTDAECLNAMGFEDVSPLPHAYYSNYKNYLYIPTEEEQKKHRRKYKLKAWFFRYQRKLKAIDSATDLSNIECARLLHKYKYEPLKPVKPFVANLSDLRVPNPEKPFQYFPYGSWIFLSECFSKDLSNIDPNVVYDPYQYEFFQQQGHNGITLVAETQMLSRAAMWAKEFIDTQIYIAKRFDKIDHVELLCFLYDGENIVKKFGFSHRFPISSNKAKKMEHDGELDGEDEIKLIKLKIPYEVYNYYNHQEHRIKFLAKLKSYAPKSWDDSNTANTKAAIDTNAEDQWKRDKLEREAQIKMQLKNQQLKKEIKDSMANNTSTN